MYGDRIKRRRERLKLTQTRLAELVNDSGLMDRTVDAPFVSRTELYGCKAEVFEAFWSAMDRFESTQPAPNGAAA